MADWTKQGCVAGHDMFAAVLNATATGLLLYKLENEADDLSLRMLFVNPAGAGILKMKPEAMAGKLLVELFPGLEKTGLHHRYAAVARGGKGFRVNEFFYTQPGLPGAWYSFNAFPLPDNCVGLLFEDISGLRSLSNEVSLFRKLLSYSSDAIFVVSPEDGAFLDVNETACRSLGYPRETLLRMKVSDVQSAAATAAQWKKLAAKIISAGAHLMDGRHRRSDGTFFPVEVSIALTELDGKRYFLASARDITERRKMEETVRELTALRGLIPICSKCKKIRDDKGFWQRVETYLEEHSSARFSHGLCEDCKKDLYGKEPWFKESQAYKELPRAPVQHKAKESP